MEIRRKAGQRRQSFSLICAVARSPEKRAEERSRCRSSFFPDTERSGVSKSAFNPKPDEWRSQSRSTDAGSQKTGNRHAGRVPSAANRSHVAGDANRRNRLASLGRRSLCGPPAGVGRGVDGQRSGHAVPDDKRRQPTGYDGVLPPRRSGHHGAEVSPLVGRGAQHRCPHRRLPPAHPRKQARREMAVADIEAAIVDIAYGFHPRTCLVCLENSTMLPAELPCPWIT